MVKATIAIITCRRPLGLMRLLSALANQELKASMQVNIIVVDNACEASVVDMVSEVNTCSPYTIDCYQESTPGIVAARNKCIDVFLKSDSQFLLFIDDDEWPEDNNWVVKMLQAQQQHQADIIASHVISVGEKGTPKWAVKLLYGNNQYLQGKEIFPFYTGNLLISRPVLEQINPAFDKRFAMTGGSDLHFAVRCKKAGFKAIYTKAPVIEEFPKSRATIAWFAKRGFRSGEGFTRSYLFEQAWYKAIPYCTFMGLARLLRALSYLGLSLFTMDKLNFVSGIFRFSSFVGSFAGFFGIQYKEYQTTHGR